MYIVVWAAIAAICSAKYDSRYAHESFGRTFSPIREYGGDCSRYCLDKRPHGGELWKKGAYSCGKCKGNVGGNIWRCSCDLCQRDCSFSELYDPRGCNLKPIAARKLSGIGKALEVLGTIFKGAGNIVSNIPHPAGAWAGPVIGFIGDMFHVGGFVEKNKVIDGIQKDINERTDALVKCFDQRVIQFKPKMYDYSMREAISSYQIALNTEASDSDIKESVTSDAWVSHIKVIDSKFKGKATDDEALFLYTMFMSGVVNDFSSTFVLISIDYLKFLKMSESPDFDMVYDKTIDGMDALLAYGKDAKWKVLEDWTKDLHAMPCRNGQSLDDELKAWEDSFYGEYLEPIQEFKKSIEKIFVTGMPGIEEGTSGSPGSSNVKNRNALIKKSCSVNVLSVDHKSGVNGKYFNFDMKALDAILGRKDWSGDRLAVSNGKKVVVWRKSNGGSKGDAHGRYDPFGSAKKNDWSVGDKITFVDC